MNAQTVAKINNLISELKKNPRGEKKQLKNGAIGKKILNFWVGA